MKRQFELNNKELLISDTQFWKHYLEGMLELYKTTSADDESHKNQRAYCAAKLAGLGLALHEHYSACVDAMGFMDDEDTIHVGMTAYDIGMKHSNNMEHLASKKVS